MGQLYYMLTSGFPKEYDGHLSFATDAWMSPNQQAYVVITVHLENQREPVAMLPDIVKVMNSHIGENFATAFVKIMGDHEFSMKYLTR